jgi:hypothetical protein
MAAVGTAMDARVTADVMAVSANVVAAIDSV